jgi:hypothetical protein
VIGLSVRERREKILTDQAEDRDRSGHDGGLIDGSGARNQFRYLPVYIAVSAKYFRCNIDITHDTKSPATRETSDQECPRGT